MSAAACTDIPDDADDGCRMPTGGGSTSHSSIVLGCRSTGRLMQSIECPLDIPTITDDIITGSDSGGARFFPDHRSISDGPFRASGDLAKSLAFTERLVVRARGKTGMQFQGLPRSIAREIDADIIRSNDGVHPIVGFFGSHRIGSGVRCARRVVVGIGSVMASLLRNVAIERSRQAPDEREIRGQGARNIGRRGSYRGDESFDAKTSVPRRVVPRAKDAARTRPEKRAIATSPAG